MAFVVSYAYSYDDYLALIRARRAIGMFRGVGGVLHYILGSIAFLFVLGGLTDWNTTSLADVLSLKSLAIMIFGIAAVCAVIASIDLFFDRVVYRLVFRRYALANAELTIAVDADNIRWSAKGVTASLAWPLVKRVYLAKEHVIVFISKVEGLVFARRGLQPPTTFDELVSFLRARVPVSAPAPVAAGAVA